MKNLFLIAVFILLINVPILTQTESVNFPDFEKYFLDETMRIDYFHIGRRKRRIYYSGSNLQIWNLGGKQKSFDGLNLGRYCVKIYDAESNH